MRRLNHLRSLIAAHRATRKHPAEEVIGRRGASQSVKVGIPVGYFRLERACGIAVKGEDGADIASRYACGRINHRAYSDIGVAIAVKVGEASTLGGVELVVGLMISSEATELLAILRMVGR